MCRLLSVTLASSLVLAPAVAAAQSATPVTDAAPAPDEAKKNFDVDVVRYFISSSNAEKLLARCWQSHADFKGTLRYRLVLDDSGKVTGIMPFAANKGESEFDKAARAAIESCAPYTIAATDRTWTITDVSFTGQHVAVVPLPNVPAQKRKAPTDLRPSNDPLSLSHEELRDLTAQVRKCLPPVDKSRGKLVVDIDLVLNFDGSVSPGSKIVSSPSPELGQRIMKALIQCQPYLLPAEKHAAWKLIPMTVDLVSPF